MISSDSSNVHWDSEIPLYAEVVIPLALPKNYTWSIPREWTGKITVGVRVEVVLGKSKKYAGLVKQLHQKAPASFQPKDILSILDVTPVVHPLQFKLWEWIASYYCCTEGEVMAAALPAHFKLSSETIVVFNEEYGEDFSQLEQDEFLVAEGLLLRRQLRIDEIQDILDASHVYPVIRRLIDKKVCFVWESLKDNYKPKKQVFVLLHPDYEKEEKLADLLNQWSGAPRQMELLLSYLHLVRTEGFVAKKELLKKSRATDAQLKALVEKQILQLEERRVDRIKYLPREMDMDLTLTPLQEQKMEELTRQLEEKRVCLLHGVTSSGKTLLYIKLIERCIREGRQALYLLPEIALTAQLIRRLERHFGGYIGIYHSKFNSNERVEIWNKVNKGELKVVLGARSALFLPFANLGLVIADEEHDPSYKQQDPAPRYHARDAAIYYASLFDAKVVLGSATPAMETYSNAINGKFGLVTMQERYGGFRLPAIQLVDVKKNQAGGSEKVILSAELKEAITASLAAGKQVILFQNRRGYTPFQICQMCGWIPHCSNCDVTLTFHKNTHKLHCHYCGTVYAPIHTCNACGGHHFRKHHFGTERIEEELETLFPDARVARMDMDSVRGKQAHDQLIQQFEEHKIDILVGTQMVVKGLDFDLVDLVGILDADSLWGFADFRANERAFQLMEQVSGRAGRKDHSGRVVIQAGNLQHPVLGYLLQHDYASFYSYEMKGRAQFGYPPYSRLIRITFRHKQKDKVDAAAKHYAAAIHPLFGNNMIGPAEPVVNRIRGQYLMELTMKCPREMKKIEEIKEKLMLATAQFYQEKPYRGTVVIIDVDPV